MIAASSRWMSVGTGFRGYSREDKLEVLRSVLLPNGQRVGAKRRDRRSCRFTASRRGDVGLSNEDRNSTETVSQYKSFYDERRHETYAHDYHAIRGEDHFHYRDLRNFIDRFHLKGKTCLEIGSAGGNFQDLVDDYYGTDIAESLARYYHKPYRVSQGPTYPFPDGMFDAIWTLFVYEHIPDLQTSLLQIKRLLKPGGVLLFAPAWQCRPWAADGYAVRPFGDFDWRGKLIKASIPIRDNFVWRSLCLFPGRIRRHLQFLGGRASDEIEYKKLEANYDIYWTIDADACNSLDPHAAIIWFLKHGFRCLSQPTNLRVFRSHRRAYFSETVTPAVG